MEDNKFNTNFEIVRLIISSVPRNKIQNINYKK